MREGNSCVRRGEEMELRVSRFARAAAAAACVSPLVCEKAPPPRSLSLSLAGFPLPPSGSSLHENKGRGLDCLKKGGGGKKKALSPYVGGGLFPE